MLKKTITMCIMQAILSAPFVMAAPAMQLPDDIPPEVRAQFEEAMQKQQAQLGQGTEQQDSDKAAQDKDDAEKVQENLATYRVIEKSRFMIAAKAVDLDQIVPITKTDFPVITKMDFGQQFDFRAVENSALMSGSTLTSTYSEEAKMTPAEKRAKIYDLYKELITKLNESIESTDKTRFAEASSELAAFNRFIISDSCVVNQYPESDGSDVTKDVSGPAYLLFVASNARHDYLIQAEEYIREYTASPNHTLTQKIAVLKALIDKDISKDADAYMKSQVDAWGSKSYSTKELDKQAKVMLLNHPDKDAIGQEYHKFVEETNKAIVKQEYDILPSRITKAQYKALSNLDQMKYAPEQHDNYRSHDHYVKKDLSSLTAQKFSQKLSKNND